VDLCKAISVYEINIRPNGNCCMGVDDGERGTGPSRICSRGTLMQIFPSDFVI